MSKVWLLIIILLGGFFAFVFLGPSQGPGTGTGQLDIAQADDADILDPARTVYDMANRINTLIYEPLLTYDDNMNLTGLLAKDWHYNEAGMYYEFELKKGIEFHNGEPFNAEAVEYSMKRVRNIPGSKHSESLSKVLKVDAVDEYTVDVYLKEEDRYILDWFASISSAIVSPKASKGEGGNTYDMDFGTPVSPPVGTGPYKFEKWIPADRIVLTRNDEYTHGPDGYKNEGPPHIENITFHAVSEHSTREQKFERSDYDFVTSVRQSEELTSKWENNPNIKLVVQGGPSLVYLGFNCYGTENHGYGDEPVAKSVPKKVRKAVAYAIDENAIIEKALGGFASRAESWLASAIWSSTGYQENMYPYDPAKAEELLAEAGYENKVYNLSVLVAAPPDPKYIKVLSVLSDQLSEVGINMTIDQRQFTALQSMIKEKNYQAFIMGYTWQLADMIWWEWHTVRLPSPNRFWWGDDYTDPIVDDTFAMDDEVAMEALGESQRLIAEDAASIALYERPLVWAYRKDDLKNFEVHPLADDVWKFLDARLEEGQD